MARSFSAKVISAAVATAIVATVASPALALPLGGQVPNFKPGFGNLNPKLPSQGFKPNLGFKPGPTPIKFPGKYPVGGPLKVPGYGYKPHYGYGGPGWGYGAAALAGGLAIGAIAASAASASDDACFIERRRMVDDEGNLYVRRVRVCE